MSEPADASVGRPVRWPIYAVVGLVAAAILARLVFALGFFADDELPPSGVSESKQGEQWSFKELLGFLHDRGVPLAIYTSREHAQGGPVLSVCPEDYWAGRAARLVHMQQRKSANDSHEAAARMGDDGFAWGRFLFTGDRELLGQIRSAFR